MHATMMKGATNALLAATMSMAGDASAHAPPTAPCTEANAWETVTQSIRPYDGWDQVQVSVRAALWLVFLGALRQRFGRLFLLLMQTPQRISRAMPAGVRARRSDLHAGDPERKGHSR